MLKTKERDINNGICTLLALDDWHVFRMETVSRVEWGKFTGEPGMPDILAIRYVPNTEQWAISDVLWIEGKSSSGRLADHQRLWIEAERKRGALVWIAGEDFAPDVDAFLELYKRSGLCRRQID